MILFLQPHSPDNRALARECKDVKIDRVYIGSCTGGKTDDFFAAAKVFLASVRDIKSILSWHACSSFPNLKCIHFTSTISLYLFNLQGKKVKVPTFLVPATQKVCHP